ncbi:hypothetical protein D5R40_34050 [Okeania hirsuta]|uniref:Outer membrane protein beta-barrel domain-containing protein n=1 Tax=Okeania hirsuta TaxID=1458930 RepID=A0A3N6QJV2_9CYAN|nr:hypothetical protein D5R40_34050 [Okeania hirsuta]
MAVNILRIIGEFVNNPNLTNIFEYDQKVLGVYGTGSYENDVWGLKLGLRMENTDLRYFPSEYAGKQPAKLHQPFP